MDSKILIILAIVLFVLIILNHVSIIITPPGDDNSSNSQSFGYIQTLSNCSNLPGCCSLTKFGCCPDGVNSRVDSFGTNCPKTYNPGYIPNTTIVQPNIPPKTVYIPPQNIIKPILH